MTVAILVLYSCLRKGCPNLQTLGTATASASPACTVFFCPFASGAVLLFSYPLASLILRLHICAPRRREPRAVLIFRSAIYTKAPSPASRCGHDTYARPPCPCSRYVPSQPPRRLDSSLSPIAHRWPFCSPFECFDVRWLAHIRHHALLSRHIHLLLEPAHDVTILIAPWMKDRPIHECRHLSSLPYSGG